jgi:7 transmembrane sweet-taste receptor of 3 GCPR
METPTVIQNTPSRSTAAYFIMCSYLAQQGVGIAALSVATAVYAAVALALVHRHRDHWAIRYSHSLFCHLVLAGCIALTVVAVLHLEAPTAGLCIVRPLVQHVALTFTLSCLLTKVSGYSVLLTVWYTSTMLQAMVVETVKCSFVKAQATRTVIM